MYWQVSARVAEDLSESMFLEMFFPNLHLHDLGACRHDLKLRMDWEIGAAISSFCEFMPKSSKTHNNNSNLSKNMV